MKLRLIRQSEAASCGLTCLATAHGVNGIYISLPEMRRCFPLSLMGLELGHTIHIAQLAVMLNV